MSGDRIKYLFYQHYHNSASAEERDELMALITSGVHSDDLKYYIQELLENEAIEHRLPDGEANEILFSILQQHPPVRQHNENAGQIAPQKTHLPKVRAFTAFHGWKIAAAIALLVIISWYWLSPVTGVRYSADSSNLSNDLPPGRERAYLSLTDGTEVNLETEDAQSILSSHGISNDRSKGELSYLKPSPVKGFNKLVAPLGGQYKLILPDGSKAWLNAGSTLRFPNIFDSGQRVVQMTGEIYFEIAPDQGRPFRVEIIGKNEQKESEIKVLGTHFNVFSYPDEPHIQTTLLEGIVEISRNGVSKQLTPGQQAQISPQVSSSGINIATVDTEAVVAWKNGRFEFNGNIREIMRQIARWYDVEVEYQGNFENKSFVGAIAKQKQVSDVLKMLELTGGIRFEVREKTIIVKSTNAASEP